jgi:hypothetical protein
MYITYGLLYDMSYPIQIHVGIHIYIEGEEDARTNGTKYYMG